MITALKFSLALAGLAIVGGGIALWARFGSTIAFDLAASGFVGCLF